MNKFLTLTCLILSLSLYGSVTQKWGQITQTQTEVVRSEAGGLPGAIYARPEVIVVPMSRKDDVYQTEYRDGMPYWKNLTTGDYLFIEPPR